jgi:hypothetical protein
MSKDTLNTTVPVENRTVQKAVRFTPTMWAEVEACIQSQGLPDFSSFATMATRTLLDRFARERAKLEDVA